MFLDVDRNLERLNYRFYLLVLTVTVIAASLLIDMAVFDRTFLSEGAPDWQLSGLVRFLLSLLGAIAILFAVSPDNLPERRLLDVSGSAGWALLSIALISYGVHVWTVYALVQTPESLDKAVTELGPIALLQEAAIALAFVLILSTVVVGKELRRVKIFGVSGKMLAFGIAIAVLLLFLEETSYGQHYFGWATPASFEGNTQQETNLHNFHTIRFEMIYYGVAFAAFIAAPLLVHALPWQLRIKLDHFIPPADFVFLAVPLVAGMYASWNIMPQQMMFLAGALIYVMLLIRWRMLKSPEMIGIVVMVTVQCLYLALGVNQVSNYEVAEIRENSICFSLLGYAVWFLHRNQGVPER